MRPYSITDLTEVFFPFVTTPDAWYRDKKRFHSTMYGWAAIGAVSGPFISAIFFLLAFLSIGPFGILLSFGAVANGFLWAGIVLGSSWLGRGLGFAYGGATTLKSRPTTGLALAAIRFGILGEAGGDTSYLHLYGLIEHYIGNRPQSFSASDDNGLLSADKRQQFFDALLEHTLDAENLEISSARAINASHLLKLFGDVFGNDKDLLPQVLTISQNADLMQAIRILEAAETWRNTITSWPKSDIKKLKLLIGPPINKPLMKLLNAFAKFESKATRNFSPWIQPLFVCAEYAHPLPNLEKFQDTLDLIHEEKLIGDERIEFMPYNQLVSNMPSTTIRAFWIQHQADDPLKKSLYFRLILASETEDKLKEYAEKIQELQHTLKFSPEVLTWLQTPEALTWLQKSKDIERLIKMLNTMVILQLFSSGDPRANLKKALAMLGPPTQKNTFTLDIFLANLADTFKPSGREMTAGPLIETKSSAREEEKASFNFQNLFADILATNARGLSRPDHHSWMPSLLESCSATKISPELAYQQITLIMDVETEHFKAIEHHYQRTSLNYSKTISFLASLNQLGLCTKENLNKLSEKIKDCAYFMEECHELLTEFLAFTHANPEVDKQEFFNYITASFTFRNFKFPYSISKTANILQVLKDIPFYTAQEKLTHFKSISKKEMELSIGKIFERAVNQLKEQRLDSKDILDFTIKIISTSKNAEFVPYIFSKITTAFSSQNISPEKTKAFLMRVVEAGELKWLEYVLSRLPSSPTTIQAYCNEIFTTTISPRHQVSRATILGGLYKATLLSDENGLENFKSACQCLIHGESIYTHEWNAMFEFGEIHKTQSTFCLAIIKVCKDSLERPYAITGQERIERQDCLNKNLDILAKCYYERKNYGLALKTYAESLGYRLNTVKMDNTDRETLTLIAKSETGFQNATEKSLLFQNYQYATVRSSNIVFHPSFQNVRKRVFQLIFPESIHGNGKFAELVFSKNEKILESLEAILNLNIEARHKEILVEVMALYFAGDATPLLDCIRRDSSNGVNFSQILHKISSIRGNFPSRSEPIEIGKRLAHAAKNPKIIIYLRYIFDDPSILSLLEMSNPDNISKLLTFADTDADKWVHLLSLHKVSQAILKTDPTLATPKTAKSEMKRKKSIPSLDEDEGSPYTGLAQSEFDACFTWKCALDNPQMAPYLQTIFNELSTDPLLTGKNQIRNLSHLLEYEDTEAGKSAHLTRLQKLSEKICSTKSTPPGQKPETKRAMPITCLDDEEDSIRLPQAEFDAFFTAENLSDPASSKPLPYAELIARQHQGNHPLSPSPPLEPPDSTPQITSSQSSSIQQPV